MGTPARLLAFPILLALGCREAKTTADAPPIRLKKGLVIPAEWRDVSCYIGIDSQEFVATADAASWLRWCGANGMPSEQPDRVDFAAVRSAPRFWHVKLSPAYDKESAKRLLFRRSSILPNGAHRRCWFDPELQRIAYQEYW